MRSLVLAGGGMRVAWQTGVLIALEEEGLAFDHVDGTSGGILTAAQVLSGHRAEAMAERWQTLDVRRFASLLPLREYLRPPWASRGFGDADGIVTGVFPHLGVDVDAIRRSSVAGSFNVADFATKTCVPVPHTAVDAPLLAAGMSLPLWMPPLHRDGRVWTDAVWIKDANVTEALRRGADEIWLLWCIGNTPTYGDGAFEQYVHMIELSASGALFAELAAAREAGRRFTLHVVKPATPLPLDPEFFTGRISAASLIAMGYRDARRYLAGMTAAGVPQDPTCTAMADPPRGARVAERLHGRLNGAPITVDLTVELPSDPAAAGALAGSVDHAPWGGRSWLADGVVEPAAGGGTYRAVARAGHGRIDLEITRRPGWPGLRNAVLTVTAAGEPVTTTLHATRREALAQLSSVTPVGAHGLRQRVAATAGYLHRARRPRRPADPDRSDQRARVADPTGRRG